MKHTLLFVALAGLLLSCHKEDAVPDPWQPVTVMNSQPPISVMEDVHFSSAQVGWIGGGIDQGLMGHPVLLKSIDGGQTWTSIDLASLQIIKFVTMYPVSDQLLYACGIDNSTGSLFDFPRVMYKSEDGGNTWRKLASTNFSNGSFGLYFFDAQMGLSVNISTVQKTTDGGVTWRTVFDEGLAGIDKLQCFKSGIGYAGGGNSADLVVALASC